MQIDVIIVAAGLGKRLGASIPKQYLKLGNKTILEHTVDAVLACSYVNNLIIVLNKNDTLFKTLPLNNLKNLIIVEGGKERQDSVFNGLKAATTSYVMVHDAARPFVSKEDLNKLCSLANLQETGGILACKVSDTLKKVDTNIIEHTVDRSCLYRALTPQLFKRQLLIEAFNYIKANNLAITDEASAMEIAGFKVKIVEGSTLNFKITESADLEIARALIRERVKL